MTSPIALLISTNALLHNLWKKGEDSVLYSLSLTPPGINPDFTSNLSSRAGIRSIPNYPSSESDKNAMNCFFWVSDNKVALGSPGEIVNFKKKKVTTFFISNMIVVASIGSCLSHDSKGNRTITDELSVCICEFSGCKGSMASIARDSIPQRWMS